MKFINYFINMTLLQVIFIVSAFIILLIWIDIARKQRFNFLHIFIFIAISLALLLFSIYPGILNKFWKIFWVQRGADVLVYLSIIFLIYFVLFLFNKIEKEKAKVTKLVREISFLEYELKNNDKK